MHDCPYIGCPEQLPRNLLACRRHWGLVSADIRRAVYAGWRNAPLGAAYLHARAAAVAEMNARNPKARAGAEAGP